MSTPTKPAAGIYYGWYVVAAAMISLMLAVGSTMHAFGLYVLPVSGEFRLSRAGANTGLILLNTGAAIAALFVGRIIDRFPARLVMACGGAVLSICLIALGLSRSLWVSGAILALPLGFALASAGTMTAPLLVSRWFTRRRARAMAITMMGLSAGTIAVVPATAYLIDAIGWRLSLISVGVICGIVLLAIPLALRDVPRPGEIEEPSAQHKSADPLASVPKLSSIAILSQPRFWCIALSSAVGTSALQAFVLSLVPAAVDGGSSPTLAAGFISALGGAGIAGKLLVATSGDRFERRYVLAGIFTLVSLSGAVLLSSRAYEAFLCASLLAGVAAGASIPLVLALIADEFGAENFGSVNGFATFITAISGAAAVRLSGEVFDRTGSYSGFFAAQIVLGLLAASLMLGSRLTPPPLPVRSDQRSAVP